MFTFLFIVNIIQYSQQLRRFTLPSFPSIGNFQKFPTIRQSKYIIYEKAARAQTTKVISGCRKILIQDKEIIIQQKF